MKVYRARCTDCDRTADGPTRLAAKQALHGHVCQHRCGLCGLLFPLLVDGALCVICDAVIYPFPRRIA